MTLMPTASPMSGQQLDEAGVWQLDKRLVVLRSHIRLLLPERVLADDQGAHAFLFQELNDPTADGMQLLHDPSIALRRDRISRNGRCGADGCLWQAVSESGRAVCCTTHLSAFKGRPFDPLGSETGFVARWGRQHVDHEARWRQRAAGPPGQATRAR